jgi:hypothetical protein
MTNPKVLLAAACGRTPPSALFFDDFYRAQLPTNGSKRARITGSHVGLNMNAIIDTALTGSFDYICYVDDDLRFDADFVLRLLSHGKARVAPLVCERLPPFRPYLFQGFKGPALEYLTLTANDRGLIRVPMIAGMPGLIATEIFARIERPWFPENIYLKDGSFFQGDLQFTKKLYEAGVESWCDLDCRVHHTGQYHVSQKFDEATQTWGVQMTFQEGQTGAIASDGPERTKDIAKAMGLAGIA